MAGLRLLPGDLAAEILRRSPPSGRVLIGIAGAPGSGKTTLSEHLAEALSAGGHPAAAVPMDGFHYDDCILNARGDRARKGAPDTFDFDGFEALLIRLKSGGRDVAIPVFDRAMELSRNAARIVTGDTSFVVAEGNYLLLDEDPWRRLRPLFDIAVFAEVSEAELERRLTGRWLGFGYDLDYAQGRARGHDMDNARRITGARLAADILVANGQGMMAGR